MSISGVPAGIVNTEVDPAVADGMILSMSRQSLCASPLSMAHSPKGGEEQEQEQEQERDEIMQQTSEREIYKTRKPSLPSLSSSLGRAHLMSNSDEQHRTGSLPPLTGSGSPPRQPLHYQQQRNQQQQHHQSHHTTTHSHADAQPYPSMLPPIPSMLLSRRNEPGHSSSSFEARAGALPPLLTKPMLTTRNGRVKSTSYPLSTSATIFEHPPSLIDDAMAMTDERKQVTASAYNDRAAARPLPRRASSRAPLSSTRDDITTSPPPDAVLAKIGGSSAVVTSPGQYGDDENDLLQESMSGSSRETQQQYQHQHASDRRTTQRRKSTYEDFMEVFGSNGSA
jgi:hypothetical protein